MRMIKLNDGYNAVELNKAGVKVVYNEYCAPVLVIDEVNNKLVYTNRDEDLIDYVAWVFSVEHFTKVEQSKQEFKSFIDNI